MFKMRCALVFFVILGVILTPLSVSAQEPGWAINTVVPEVRAASLPGSIPGELCGFKYQDGFYGPEYCAGFSESVTDGATEIVLPFVPGYTHAVLSASTAITSSYAITITDATTRVVTLDGEGYAKLWHNGVERMAEYNLLRQESVPVGGVPITGDFIASTSYTATIEASTAQTVTFSTLTLAQLTAPMNNRIRMDTTWSGEARIWYSKPSVVYLPWVGVEQPVCEQFESGLEIHILSKGVQYDFPVDDYNDGIILTLPDGEDISWTEPTKIWITSQNIPLQEIHIVWKQYEPVIVPLAQGFGLSEFVFSPGGQYAGQRLNLHVQMTWWPGSADYCRTGVRLDLTIDP